MLLIALSAKNAILIVEMAREGRAAGKSIPEATVDASRVRFRPILMTSFTFILGVLPLVVASGAGAAARRSLGVAVAAGMLASTCLAVLFVPSLFVVLQGWIERKKPAGWRRCGQPRSPARPSPDAAPKGIPRRCAPRDDNGIASRNDICHPERSEGSLWCPGATDLDLVLAKFFIERPVLANVIAFVTMLMGGVALGVLPVAQYPPITPPTIQVTASYPGANLAHRRRHGRAADRAAGQRRRGHALHAVDRDVRRPLHADRHLPGRH